MPREQRFQVLVAANVCAVVAREIRAGEEPDREDLELFSELLGEEVERRRAPPPPSSRRRLRIGRARRPDRGARAELEQHVRRKLEIARPGYADG